MSSENKGGRKKREKSKLHPANMFFSEVIPGRSYLVIFAPRVTSELLYTLHLSFMLKFMNSPECF